eukprot:14134089-Ditylum_brightwellii.AAC.1
MEWCWGVIVWGDRGIVHLNGDGVMFPDAKWRSEQDQFWRDSVDIRGKCLCMREMFVIVRIAW